MKTAHYIFLFCIILLCGCASHTKSTLPEDTRARWEHFIAKNESQEAYLFKGSLRTGKENETHRFNFSMKQGIIPKESALSSLFSPTNGIRGIKMDIYTGMGGILTHIFVSGKQILVYYPKENKMVFGEMTPANIRKLLDVSIPIDLNELYALLFGIKSGLDKDAPIEESNATADGTVVYKVKPHGKALEIGLDSHGKMVSWKNDEAKFLFTYAEAPFPKKINGNFFTEDGTIPLYINISGHTKLDIKDEAISPVFPQQTRIYFLD